MERNLKKPYSIADIKQSIANKPVSKEKVKGAMIYDHKTGGSLQVMSSDKYSDYKKQSSRKGQSSTLRNVLHANGRLQ